jgi:hypothetical protein
MPKPHECQAIQTTTLDPVPTLFSSSSDVFDKDNKPSFIIILPNVKDGPTVIHASASKCSMKPFAFTETFSPGDVTVAIKNCGTVVQISYEGIDSPN